MKRRSLRQSDDAAYSCSIADACLPRTTNVGARTVPDRLSQLRADDHAVRLTSSRFPCARFPRLRPFAGGKATGAIYSGTSGSGKEFGTNDGQIAKFERRVEIEIENDPSAAPAAIPPDLAATYRPADRYAFLQAGGARLRYAWWNALKAPRGTVLILPGRVEFIEKYATEVVGELLA